MEREKELKDCKHVTDHRCAFKGEPTLEDCLFCLPTSAIMSYRRALMVLGTKAEMPFSDAFVVYLEAESARAKGGKFHELMELNHPEVFKRNKPRVFAVMIGPNPILDEDNPLTR